jgi:hypothetical protein
VATLADLLVHIGVDADDVDSSVDQVESRFLGMSNNVVNTVAGMSTAAGAALEGFARQQAPLVESSRNLAAATGMSSDAIRDLAIETSNVTFPLEDAYSLMETGRQAGLKSADQLQEYATFWDTLGDATGESATELASAGQALRAVGIEAGNESQALSALGFVTRETTGSTAEFLKFLDRSGPELNEMGLNVNDAAAMLGVMEHELGMSGRTARQEFRSAVNEADGDLNVMLDTLGVSGATLDEYRAKVSQSSGVIQEQADVHAESYTWLQKIQHGATELMHRYSGLTDVASSLAVPLMAIGPALKGSQMAWGVLATSAQTGMLSHARAAAATAANWVMMAARSTAGAAVVAGSWLLAAGANAATAVASTVAASAKIVAGWVRMGAVAMARAAMMAAAWLVALGPIGWVIAAVAAVVLAIALNWDKVKAITGAAWDWVSAKVSGAWEWIKGAVGSAADWVVSKVAGAFTAAKDWAIRKALELVGWVRGLPGRIVGALGNLGSLLVNAGRSLIEGLWNGIRAMGSWLKNKILDFIRSFVPGPVLRYLGISSPSRLFEWIGEQVGAGLAGGIDDSRRPVADAALRLAGAAVPDVPGLRRLDGGRGQFAAELSTSLADAIRGVLAAAPINVRSELNVDGKRLATAVEQGLLELAVRR